jgi:hypothetical protein
MKLFAPMWLFKLIEKDYLRFGFEASFKNYYLIIAKK